MVSAINLADLKPRTFLCASAVGYYGNRGDEELDESSASGESWLSEVCRTWENRAAQARCRVVHLRFGIILSNSGGALPKMIRPFQVGLGGPIGSGDQWISWITIDDAVRAILHLVDNAELHGPVNVVSPEPVRNKEFSRVLANLLRRPALFRVPAALLRIVLGEMADELLLVSERVRPIILERSGFQFQHRTIENAFAELLTRSR